MKERKKDRREKSFLSKLKAMNSQRGKEDLPAGWKQAGL